MPSLYVCNAIYTNSWGRATYICAKPLSEPGLEYCPLEPYEQLLIDIHTFSFKKMYLNMSSAKRWPFCFGPNVSKCCQHLTGRNIAQVCNDTAKIPTKAYNGQVSHSSPASVLSVQSVSPIHPYSTFSFCTSLIFTSQIVIYFCQVPLYSLSPYI